MNLANSLRQHGLLFAFSAALLATACGGTFTGGAGAGGGTGTAGAGVGGGSAGSGIGGGFACTEDCVLCEGPSTTRPGECCPICEPSGGSGGTSSGGGPSAGSPNGGGAGGSTCNGVACPDIGCAQGWKPVYESGACCPTCVPDGGAGAGGVGGCANNGCPSDCGTGYRLEQKPGECCPSCVPNNACTEGQQSYDTLRQKLISQPGAVACKVDKDCALLSGNAYCGDECLQMPVNAAAASSIESELDAYAAKNCSTCTPVYPPCAASLPPFCALQDLGNAIGGFCTARTPIAG